MSGCCTPGGTARYFDRHTRRYEKKFRRKGLDAQQSMLLGAIRATGLDGRTVLEIGCGVGGLQLGLLGAGAARATGVDLSAAMIAQAEENASYLGMASRADFRTGDFLELAQDLPMADIVALDKVVCCTARGEELLRTSLGKARATYAISYPRNSLAAKVYFKSVEFAGRRLAWSFHPYYYEPEWIRETILGEGWRAAWAGVTPIWAVEVYSKSPGGIRETGGGS